MRAFLVIHLCDKLPDARSGFMDVVIGVEVNFFFLEGSDQTFRRIRFSQGPYCHRKIGPLSKPRLWYTNNLLERSLRWRTKRKRRRFTPEFKAKVVLEALSGESSQAELCRRYNLSEDQLSKWKQQVVENVASLFCLDG